MKSLEKILTGLTIFAIPFFLESEKCDAINLPSTLSWERNYDFSYGGAYTHRSQEISCSNSDVDKVESGTYYSTYTGSIDHAYSVTVHNALFTYFYSSYVSGGDHEMTFDDVSGRATPRRTDISDPKVNLIVNTDTGNVVDMDSGLNFYYGAGIESHKFTADNYQPSNSSTPNIPQAVKLSINKGASSISWKPDINASEYEVEVDGSEIHTVYNTSYIHSGLKSATKHTYRIRGKNSNGTSDWSSEVAGIVPLEQAAINITNNKAGIDDRVVVNGLVEGDTINVYNAATGGNLLGSGTVNPGESSVEIKIPQLGQTTGTVYVSVANVDKLESSRTSQSYTSEVSPSLSAANIAVVNNRLGIDDSIAVNGLTEGDIINVYSAATAGNLLGSATVSSGENSATIKIPQLGQAAGTVYVSVIKLNKLESARTPQSYTSEISPSLSAANIAIVNNYVGTDDTVTVSGLAEGDIINVYDAATAGNLLGSGTVLNGGNSVTINVPQLGSQAGTVYVSVIKLNKLEGARVPKVYLVEPTTTAVLASAISVTNNKAGIDDSVLVTGLTEGDTINVYDASAAGNLLGTGTVKVGESNVEIKIPQLGQAGGKVYVTVKKEGKLESARTPQSYISEISAALSAANIAIVNNYVGTDDTVTVGGLAEGDIINVYDAATAGNLLGIGTVLNGGNSVTINVPQLGSQAGTVYVSVIKLNKLESARVPKAYIVEPTTTAVLASAISVTNNKEGIDDSVIVSGLTEGDTINVYDAPTAGNLLGSGSVKAGESNVEIKIPQLGQAEGKVYVTVKKEGKLESARTPQGYTSEISAALSVANITVVNNYVGTDDTVTISGLSAGDIVNLYRVSAGGNVIGSGTVLNGGNSVTINVPQLSSQAGNVYVSVTRLNKFESVRVPKAYLVEPTTTAVLASAISVTNNKVGIDDSVVVTGLTEGDTINVYDALTAGNLLGTGTVKPGENSVEIKIPQLGQVPGTVYVTVKKEGKLESARTPQGYTSEISASLSAANITVVNNYVGTDDTVTVSGLASGDVVKLYRASAGGNVIGSGTVLNGGNSVTINVPQLGSQAGNVYVSVTRLNKSESARVPKAYLVEPTTTAVLASAISVTNNKAGMDDSVVVTGLTEGDTINVYDALTAGNLLGTGTVKTGENSVEIKIPQLGQISGTVYVTVKKEGKLESARTPQGYTSEISASLSAANITVVNNYVGTDDTVTVSGLASGDVVKLYRASAGGNVIGSGTVLTGGNSVTINVPQLGSQGGNVYVSVTRLNKSESVRVPKAYLVEPTTTAVLASAISVTNNKEGMDDSVVVTGLTEGDTINVYDALTAGNLLGTGTVKTGENSVEIKIPQLGQVSGTVYVAVKKEGKLESARTPQGYTSEISATPLLANILVTNNYVGTDDTVTVSGLASGDVINLYNAADGGELIGSGTVLDGQNNITINVPQLSSQTGKVYVSVIKLNKLESARAEKVYLAEPTTTAVLASAISVTNNKEGMDDSVVVAGLTEGDIISVYDAVSGGNLLGTGTVKTGDSSVEIKIPQLGQVSGTVYVTVKKEGKLESARTPQGYTSEISATPLLANILVTNNYVGTDDTVTVSGLASGDVINLYNAVAGGEIIGSGTVLDGQNNITISVPQLSSQAGIVYVSVIKLNKLESERAQKAYLAEPTTTAVSASSINVTNNKEGMDDSVVVTSLTEGDKINIYDADKGGNLLGTGTVKTGENSVEIKIPQLGQVPGTVYVTVKKEGKLESARTSQGYTSEVSATPLAANILVTNNHVGTDDTVTVSGLVAGEVINLYNAADGGELIGSGTVSNGANSVTINVPQLSSQAGTVYVSVIKLNKLESGRVAKAYNKE